MKILILGGDGMLGHQLYKYFKLKNDVKVTLRQDFDAYKKYEIFLLEDTICGIDVLEFEKLKEAIISFKPEVIINAIGIVKQRPDAKELIPSLEINALLPHKLSVISKLINARLIHMSTDCVFNGRKGNYSEIDPSDAEDIYGKTKFLGEVHESNCFTIRTSIIGREISRHTSLLDWFINQNGKTVRGFKNAFYTGFTTIEMCRIIELIINSYPLAYGVYQVSSDVINKFDLLHLIKENLNLDIEIIADTNFYCDRSLDSGLFRKEFNYTPPSWNEMIAELKLKI